MGRGRGLSFVRGPWDSKKGPVPPCAPITSHELYFPVTPLKWRAVGDVHSNRLPGGGDSCRHAALIKTVSSGCLLTRCIRLKQVSKSSVDSWQPKKKKGLRQPEPLQLDQLLSTVSSEWDEKAVFWVQLTCRGFLGQLKKPHEHASVPKHFYFSLCDSVRRACSGRTSVIWLRLRLLSLDQSHGASGVYLPR